MAHPGRMRFRCISPHYHRSGRRLLVNNLTTLFDLWKHSEDILLMFSLRVCTLLSVSGPNDLPVKSLDTSSTPSCSSAASSTFVPSDPSSLKSPRSHGRGRLLVSLWFIHHHRGNYFFLEVKTRRCRLLYLPQGSHFTNQQKKTKSEKRLARGLKHMTSSLRKDFPRKSKKERSYEKTIPPHSTVRMDEANSFFFRVP